MYIYSVHFSSNPLSCVHFAVTVHPRTDLGETSIGGLELRAHWNAKLNGH